jgi:hypothetical protein
MSTCWRLVQKIVLDTGAYLRARRVRRLRPNSGTPSTMSASTNRSACCRTVHAVPTTYALRDYAEVGGLMSYGTNLTDAYRHLETIFSTSRW